MVKTDIRTRVEKSDYGTFFFSNSFPEYDPEYVGKVLSELVRDSLLYRLGRGIYVKGKMTRFGLYYASQYEEAEAIAARDQAKILPTGAVALNMLGLSDQVQMRVVYITSGSARKVKVGGTTIEFRHAAPKNFCIQGENRRLIVQALKALREKDMTEDEYSYIVELIKQHPEPETLQSDLRVMPAWIRKVYLKALKS